jgi:2-desacetyl-2-hydroxyethyl bacteriochlorophyllide A dehydrogenase
VAIAMTRQSVYFAAPGLVQVREEETPTPAADQVLVQSLVSAISPGTELLFYRGQVPPDLAVDETIPALAGEVRYPLKYGYATVGHVVAAGVGVDRGWLGRTVFAFNPHESLFTAPIDSLIQVPPGLSSEDAAFLPNMETAVNFLMDGQPLIGERVVVLGQGVVGLLTTGLLAQFPLAALLTLDYCSQRRERSLALGAHASLDAVRPDLPALVSATWGQQQSPAGADLVYELSGNPDALNLAIELAGFDARVVVGSWYGHKRCDLALGGRFHRSRIRLISSQVSAISPQWSGRWHQARRFEVAWQMIRRLKPAHLITHRLPVSEAARAYALLDRQPCEAIQILLTY